MRRTTNSFMWRVSADAHRNGLAHLGPHWLSFGVDRNRRVLFGHPDIHELLWGSHEQCRSTGDKRISSQMPRRVPRSAPYRLRGRSAEADHSCTTCRGLAEGAFPATLLSQVISLRPKPRGCRVSPTTGSAGVHVYNLLDILVELPLSGDSRCQLLLVRELEH